MDARLEKKETKIFSLGLSLFLVFFFAFFFCLLLSLGLHEKKKHMPTENSCRRWTADLPLPNTLLPPSPEKTDRPPARFVLYSLSLLAPLRRASTSVSGDTKTRRIFSSTLLRRSAESSLSFFFARRLDRKERKKRRHSLSLVFSLFFSFSFFVCFLQLVLPQEFPSAGCLGTLFLSAPLSFFILSFLLPVSLFVGLPKKENERERARKAKEDVFAQSSGEAGVSHPDYAQLERLQPELSSCT